MPFPNEHATRIRAPGQFDPDSFRRKNGGKAVLPGAGLIDIPKTIAIIWAKTKERNKPAD